MVTWIAIILGGIGLLIALVAFWRDSPKLAVVGMVIAAIAYGMTIA